MQVSCYSVHLLVIYITFRVYLHRVRAPPTRVVVFRKYAQKAEYPMGYQFHTLHDLFRSWPTRS